jgi:nitrite reductase/ring-hydroxylating ferredoxin subunit
VTANSNVGEWRRIASVAELLVERRLVRTVDATPILVLYAGGQIVAVQNRCTHLGMPLRDGRLMGGTITCPFHGACFDLKTGRALAGPAVSPLRLFRVRTEGDDILVHTLLD